jgi:chromosome partitioning protein
VQPVPFEVISFKPSHGRKPEQSFLSGYPVMRKIATTILKGGSGKTTTAVNLAAALTSKGKRVLLVDTDTQGHASAMLGIEPTAGLAELVVGNASAEEALIEARPGLFLLAGGRNIAALKQEISRREFRSETVILETLQQFDARFDYVLVDTSPGWDQITINVLFYVEEILAPVSVEVLTLRSLLDFIENLRAIRKYNPNVNLAYVVPTFFDKRVRRSAEVYSQLKSNFAAILCDPIRYNVKLSEAPGFGQTIFEYDPRCVGAIDYGNLSERILNATI